MVIYLKLSFYLQKVCQAFLELPAQIRASMKQGSHLDKLFHPLLIATHI